MVLLIIIFASLLIVAAGFSIVLTNRRKTLEPQHSKEFPTIVRRSLFQPTNEEIAVFERAEKEEIRSRQLENQKRMLLERTGNNDFTVLIEAAKLNDSTVYEKTLDLLTDTNKIETAKIFALAAFVSDNKLPANKTFSNALLDEWRENPQTDSISTILHVSALTDSAEIYLQTVEAIFDSRKQNKLKSLSANRLFAAFDAHFRLLPTSARASGAGFVLKEKLANIRREV